jgi:hypothetical protein
MANELLHAGKQARLLSRDWGHPSMTERAVAGFGWWKLGLFQDSLLERYQLVCGKHEEERLQQNDGLPEAGIQIVVVRVHCLPHSSGISRTAFGKPGCGNAVILA